MTVEGQGTAMTGNLAHSLHSSIGVVIHFAAVFGYDHIAMDIRTDEKYQGQDDGVSHFHNKPVIYKHCKLQDTFLKNLLYIEHKSKQQYSTFDSIGHDRVYLGKLTVTGFS